MEDDIQTILGILPVWDDAIWDPLQKKQFPSAEKALESALGEFSLEEWQGVDWEDMFVGIPMVLGDLEESDWQKSIRPEIVRAVLNSANGKSLSVVLQELSPRSQDEFQRLFWQVVPGGTGNDKLGWLKAERPSIYNFIIAAPAQKTGLNPDLSGSEEGGKYLKRYRFVTDDLQQALYSYENSQVIYRTCTNHHLGDDKTSRVAALVGEVILGFVHVDDLAKTIEEKTGIDQRICAEIAADIRAGVIGGLTGSISSIYEPTGAAAEPEEKAISLGNIGGMEAEPIPVEVAPAQSVTLEEKKPDTPFILHAEDAPGPAAGRPAIRSVTSPLGGFFLKKRKPTGETASPFAKLEIPGLKPEEKRVVHYSETRTPLSQLEEPSFINVGEAQPLAQPETFAPKENKEVEPPAGGSTSDVAASGITIKPKAEDIPDKVFAAPKLGSSPMARNDIMKMPASQNPATENIGEVEPPKGDSTSDGPAILGAIKKPEPKVEGNVIDLKGE